MSSLNRVVAASAVLLTLAVGVNAQGGADPEKLDRLLAELAKKDQPGWQQIAENIRIEWSKSGSAAMDLLLQRGRDALEAEDYAAALEHLSALTDHAPDFAEAWNLRATAHYRVEQWGLALHDIRRTLALNPNHFGAMAGLGFVLEGLEQPKQALTVLRATLELNPHTQEVRDAVERLTFEVEGKTI